MGCFLSKEAVWQFKSRTRSPLKSQKYPFTKLYNCTSKGLCNALLFCYLFLGNWCFSLSCKWNNHYMRIEYKLSYLIICLYINFISHLILSFPPTKSYYISIIHSHQSTWIPSKPKFHQCIIHWFFLFPYYLTILLYSMSLLFLLKIYFIPMRMIILSNQT